ncbi:DUF2325 domain-containing protein [Arenibaculum pallidiluteum]|uniref:DUF2325 domain-containing protein n=1 Tax=Arenibaculum pallidiluteum TaxID=2812559 RepID=UPI001F3AFB60|nr:DUF2325 domain-containing protein [Arenibaculum pallidiluteum]
MCELCPRSTSPDLGGPRLKLWEIPGRYHCSIIGTCLSMAALRRLLPRAGLKPAADADDYSIHGHAVAGSGRADRLTKLINKVLDTTWGPEVRRFTAAPVHELEEMWRSAAVNGRIAGAYWALMSRRGVPEALLTEAYGTVHMLSHLLGSEARSGLRRLAQAERRNAELEDALAALRRAKREAEAERDERIAALEAKLRAAGAVGAVTRRPPGPRPAEADLLRRLALAERRVAAERSRARVAEAALERMGKLIDGRAAASEGVPAAAARAAEPRMAETGSSPAPAPAIVIDGKCILFLGGRPGAIPHLRSLVERRNGRLLHHDGGLEQTVRRLDGLVEQADMVVCPVDCISHEACLRAKRLCRRLNKPFVPVRGAGALFAKSEGRA